MIMPLAIGRLLRLFAGPPSPGDAADYARTKSVILECGDALGGSPTADQRPNYARDYSCGAAGD